MNRDIALTLQEHNINCVKAILENVITEDVDLDKCQTAINHVESIKRQQALNTDYCELSPQPMVQHFIPYEVWSVAS